MKARRGRPRRMLEEATGTWTTALKRRHTGFVDLSGEQGLLGQVEGRTIAAVTSWLNQRDPAWRARGNFVAIDTCTIFKAAVRAALPRTTLVAHHFHLVHLANTALTVQICGRRGRTGNREWELRNRFTRSAARMHGSQPDPMIDDLQALPARLGRPIPTACNAKKDLLDLLDLLALARTHPDRTLITDRLSRFHDRCATCGLPPLRRPATTIKNLMARNSRLPPHRHHQHRLRRHQPRHQDHRPRRPRLPQPRKPTPTHPLHHHPRGRGNPDWVSPRIVEASP
ncbi:transposase [Nonomuraea sp. NBC_00507]